MILRSLLIVSPHNDHNLCQMQFEPETVEDTNSWILTCHPIHAYTRTLRNTCIYVYIHTHIYTCAYAPKLVPRAHQNQHIFGDTHSLHTAFKTHSRYTYSYIHIHTCAYAYTHTHMHAHHNLCQRQVKTDFVLELWGVCICVWVYVYMYMHTSVYVYYCI